MGDLLLIAYSLQLFSCRVQRAGVRVSNAASALAVTAEPRVYPREKSVNGSVIARPDCKRLR